MKSKYIAPEMDITVISSSDIITLSSATDSLSEFDSIDDGSGMFE